MSPAAEEECPMNEQAVGFVLHALEPAEEIQVLRHLPQCASCRTVVADAEGVFTRMGGAVEQSDPPPSLRASLMARVAHTPQAQGRPRQTQVQPASPVPTPVPTPEPASGSSPHSRKDPAPGPAATPPRRPEATPSRPGPSSPPGPSGPGPRRSWLSRRGRRLVAAAVALVGVLAIGGLAVRTAQLQEQRDAEVAQAAQLQEQRDTEAARSRGLVELLEQLGRPDTRYALLGQNGPTLAAVVVADGERRVFPLALPANTTERDIYVLWGLDASGTPAALGTFDVVPTDPGAREVGAGATTDTYAQYAISLEPGRTAPTTPTEVVAIGEVTV
ncbi:anti-sigma factor [Pseudonocardia lacus]|uniref:anti-sigma factor n=1 Tax=Pseudonocardia lacus TaxID=2835865 RepID=UPI001BDCF363|nr:anti-sigma factor [Pseudonocardia lacus]